MSEITQEDALEVIGDFLRSTQGQGLQVLVQLATGPYPPAVRLNSALALTGMYDAFAMEVEAAYDVPDQVPYDTVVEDDVFAEVDYDPEVDGPVTGTGEVIAEAPGPQTSSSDGEQTGMSPAEAAEFMRERAAAARQVEEMERGSDAGGESGIGPRKPGARKRRRKHGRS